MTPRIVGGHRRQRRLRPTTVGATTGRVAMRIVDRQPSGFSFSVWRARLCCNAARRHEAPSESISVLSELGGVIA